MKRREFIKSGVAGGLGLMVGGGSILKGQTGATCSVAPYPALAKYVDALPIPTPLPHSTSYHITMEQVMAQLHRDLKPAPVWAYNGNFVGTLIEAFSGTPITVRWDNQLPSTHLFQQAIDPTIHGATADIPSVKTIVHLHGMKVLPQYDGYPEAWFTNASINANPPLSRLRLPQ